MEKQKGARRLFHLSEDSRDGIKSALWKFAPLIAVVGVGGVYATVRGCGCGERRQQDVRAGNCPPAQLDCPAAQCGSQENSSQAILIGVHRLDEINRLIVNSINGRGCRYVISRSGQITYLPETYSAAECGADKEKEVELAFQQLGKIIDSEKFDAGILNLAGKLVESSGSDAAQALRLFAMFVASGVERDEINLKLIDRLAGIVQLVSQKAGSKRLEIFDALFAAFDTEANAEFYGRHVPPPNKLDAVQTIADRSVDAEGLAFRIELADKVLKNAARSGDPTAEDLAMVSRKVCDFVDAAMQSQGLIPIQIFAPPLFKLLDSMLESRHYSIDALDENTAAVASATLSTISSKTRERFGEAVSLLGSMLDDLSGRGQNGIPAPSVMVGPIGEAGTPTAEVLIGIVGAIATRSNSADEVIGRMGIVKKFVGSRYARSQVDGQLAARLCNTEKLIADKGGNEAVALFENLALNGQVSSPGMLRLVQMALERGGESAARVLDRFRTAGGERYTFPIPFYDDRIAGIKYGDYDVADGLVKTIFRSDSWNMERLVNFAYGISVLGRDKTREMYNKFGVEYFCRYGNEILKAAATDSELRVRDSFPRVPSARDISRRDNREPVLLVVSAKTDWNGAFYYMGELRPLLRHYRLILAEVDSEPTFYSKIQEVAGWYGRISALVIGGHGNPVSISLGTDWGRYGDLSFGARRVMILQDSFVANPVVVLESCSTGMSEGAIGSLFSRELDARVFAPTSDSSLRRYILDSGGGIIGAAYVDAQTREYYRGSSRVVEDAPVVVLVPPRP